jgi:hypothetical protein
MNRNLLWYVRGLVMNAVYSAVTVAYSQMQVTDKTADSDIRD